VLRAGYRPACIVGEDRRAKLAALGINTIQAMRSTARIGVRPRTLAAGRAGNMDWQFLAARRLALFILNSVERGTRWVALAAPHVEVAESVMAQVRGFLEEMHQAGAFGERRLEDAFFVICDERVNSLDSAPHEFQFVLGFAALREHEFHCFRIAHSAAGASIQPVSPNRLSIAQYSPAELEWVDSIASQLQP
jgi:phage tail sheath protein FI